MREKYTPRIQEERDKLAEEVSEKRKERDKKRKGANKLSSRIKDSLGIEGGSSQLNTEADELTQKAKKTLRAGKVNLEAETVFEHQEEMRRKYQKYSSDLLRLKQQSQDSGELTTENFSSDDLGDLLSEDNYYSQTLKITNGLLSDTLESKRHPKVKELHARLILDNIDAIRENLARGNPSPASLEAIYLLSEHGDQVGVEAAMQAIEEVWPEFRRILLETKSERYKHEEQYSHPLLRPASSLLISVLKNGDQKQKIEARKIFEEALRQRNPNPRIIPHLLTFLRSNDDSLKREAIIALDNLLKSVGLEREKDEMIETWDSSQTLANHNAQRILELEKLRPGTVKILAKEFGIRNFCRYSTELLMKQVEEKDKNERPYGIAIYTTEDHKGAFKFRDRMLDNFLKGLDGRYYFRIFEAKNKTELARYFLGLEKKHGPDQKISFAIVGGHGTEDSIELGPAKPVKTYADLKKYEKGIIPSHLMLSDLENPGVQKARRFFEPNATIVLLSCSTGAEGGIGQRISKVYGAKVIAPNKSVSQDSITAHFSEEGKLEIKVRYDNNDAKMEYEPGTPREKP